MAYHQSSRLAAIGFSSLALLSLVLFAGCAERLETETNAQDPIQLAFAIRSWQQGKTEAMVHAMEQLSEATGLFFRSPTIESRLVWQSAWISAHDNFLGASIQCVLQKLVRENPFPTTEKAHDYVEQPRVSLNCI